MSLLLRRLAAAVPAPLRRSICTAASCPRPPWTMLHNKPIVDASGAPSQGARASLHLHEASLASQLSVPARIVAPDGEEADFLDGTVHAASSDGVLLLDFADSRHRAPVIGNIRHTWLNEIEPLGGAVEPDVSRFVCNPLSGQLFRLPAPDVDVAKMSTPFGLLTQSSQGSHGPPDRYVVAQLSRAGSGGPESRRVVRRFLSETGEWDEQELVGPSTTPGGRVMRTDLKHEVVAFGGRLWWVDVSWGVCSVDPFSDQPEHRFVELPARHAWHGGDSDAGQVPACGGQRGEAALPRGVQHQEPLRGQLVFTRRRGLPLDAGAQDKSYLNRARRLRTVGTPHTSHCCHRSIQGQLCVPCLWSSHG